jgi:hypothetical protein
MRTPEYYEKLEAMKALAEMRDSQDAKAVCQKMLSISRDVQQLGNDARERMTSASDAEKPNWEKVADALEEAEAAFNKARLVRLALG